MWRYLIALLLVTGTLPDMASATSVTKIEWGGLPAAFGVNLSQQQARCPRAAEAGDTIVVVGELGSSAISTIGDDKGDTYNADKTVSGAQFGFIYRASNVIAGARIITITLSSSMSGTHAQCFVFNNIQTSPSPLDVSCGQDNASNTSQPCGSMTTTQAQDEIIHCAWMDSLPTTGTVPTWTAGAGFYLAAVHNFDGLACEVENQASAAPINPTLTASSAIAAVNVGVAYKTTSVGGSPLTASIYVPNTQWLNFSEWNEQGGTVLGAGPYTVNFPCDSNSHGIDVSWESNALTMTGISSTPANTWVLTTTLTSGGENMGHATANVTNCTSSFKITYTLSGTPDASSKSFESVIWAIRNTSGIDTVNSPCNTTGTTTNTSGSLPDNPCTTSQPGELMAAIRQNVGETVTSSSVNNGGFLYDLEPDYGAYASFAGAEDGGAAVMYAPTAGNYTINWVYSNYESGTQISNYLTQTMVWTGVGIPFEDYWYQSVIQKSPVTVTVFSGLLFGLMLAGASLAHPWILGGGNGARIDIPHVNHVHLRRVMGWPVRTAEADALLVESEATGKEGKPNGSQVEL